MKTNKSKEDLIVASEALYYEIMMLNECVKFANKTQKMIYQNSFNNNILIESFGVHLRNIMEFFGMKKKNYITYNYFAESDISISFPHNLSKKYKVKINNLLSHLTFERLKFKGKEKEWHLSQITNEVNENVREFFRYADNDLLSNKLKRYIQL